MDGCVDELKNNNSAKGGGTLTSDDFGIQHHLNSSATLKSLANAFQIEPSPRMIDRTIYDLRLSASDIGGTFTDLRSGGRRGSRYTMAKRLRRP
jgi:hypothetical protein